MTGTSAELTALAAIAAVEQRDLERLAALYDRDVEFDWQPGLPYSGHYQHERIADMTEHYRAVWEQLQPTEAERRMDAAVVASSGETIVIEYQCRGVDHQARRFETPVLARYRVRDGRLVAAQMFYWDLEGLRGFLASAGRASDDRQSRPSQR